jgi:hypothetical protein
MNPDKDKLSELISKPISAKKESKRTTFKLSKQSLNAIDWIVNTYEMPAKEVFDVFDKSDELVAHVVEITRDDEEKDLPRERKTFVISKKTLNQLNRIAKSEGVQRDILVEKMVLIYKALLEKILEDEERNEKKALNIISDFLKQAEKTEAQLKKLLDNSNPILDRFSIITLIIDNLESAIDAKLTVGTPIDPDAFSPNS